MQQLLARLGIGWATLVLMVIAVSLAIPTVSSSRFAGEVALGAWIVTAALGNVVVLGRAASGPVLARAVEWIEARLTMPDGAGDPRRWDRALPWVLGAWVLAVSASLSWFVFEGVPHIDDSVAYLFQAKTLALGRISVPLPPDSASFAVQHLVQADGAWFSKYSPGWPALLSLGVLARVPWIINPVLGGAAIVLAHVLVRRVYDRGTANVVALLLAVSPWLITSSSGMMSHPATLACALLALVAIEQQRGQRVGWWSVAAGASLGLLYLVRPPDAAALGVVAALWGWGLWGQRLSIGSLAVIAAVAIGVAALSLPYNAALTGNPLLAPHRMWSILIFGPDVDVFGFGANVGIPDWRDHDPLPGHGLADVVINTNRNLVLLSSELFGWAIGSLWLLLPALGLRREWRRADGLMVAVIVAVGLIYTAYWYPGGPDFGPRFWYLMIVPLVVFTARGALEMASQVQRTTGARHAGRAVGAVIVAASLTAVLAGIPWRAIAKYHRYREIGGDVRSLSSGGRLSNALVFVRSGMRADYQAAFNFISPTLDDAAPVFALDAGPTHRGKVLQRYPDRPVWIIGRPADGSPRLVILGGPFPPGTDPASGMQPLQSSMR